MARYDDRHEDEQRNVVEELSGLAHRARYGQAMIDAQRDNSGDESSAFVSARRRTA